jgi:hypothetical protein
VSSIDDQDPVEQFTADVADEPFGDRVRPRPSNRDLDDVGAVRGEHGVEGCGEPGVTVPDQEPNPAAGVVHRMVEVHEQVAGLLDQPGSGRMRVSRRGSVPGGWRAAR